jgi:hypothetical protein
VSDGWKVTLGIVELPRELVRDDGGRVELPLVAEPSKVDRARGDEPPAGADVQAEKGAAAGNADAPTGEVAPAPAGNGSAGAGDGAPPAGGRAGTEAEAVDEGAARPAATRRLADGAPAVPPTDTAVAAPAREEPAGPEPSVTRAARAGGRLAPLEGGRVAYITADPYEVWFASPDGTVTQLPVDEASVAAPEKSVAVEPWMEVDRHDTSVGLVAWQDSHLLVERVIRMFYRLGREEAGLAAGTEAVTWFSLIDRIDPQSGRVVERIDVRGIKLAGADGQWVGCKGRDLVLANAMVEEPVLALASAD